VAQRPVLTRRELIAGAVGALLFGGRADASYRRALGPPVSPGPGKTVAVRLTAAERATALPCFGGAALPLWTFAEGAWPPLIRLDLGDRLEATLENRLPRAHEHTSIHWHGIRLPNDQDGVPYLVQPPVQPGESFRYAFTPPDAGTFFFHTHCNTAEQLGRGLEGVLIIDGDATRPYDVDTVLLLRDWRIEPGTAQFASFTTRRGAGRAGTYGPLRCVNGACNPEVPLPASGDCRLRVINTDPTRIMRIGVEGADAAIVAIDGIALPPVPLTAWSIGPGMRFDLVLRAPPVGGVARLVDSSGDDHVELARLVGTGPQRRATAFDPAPLRAGRVPVPDLANATRLEFRFQSNDAGVAIAAEQGTSDDALDPLCMSSNIFWTINDRAWPGRDHGHLPPPLAVLQRGRSYVLAFRNETMFAHPIHIHGHFFTVLRSNKQGKPAHHADTLLVLPDEQLEVAFVADNPGNWMFHCHIIEHQENGMMGWFRIA
jgi:FtsP/CotA-like multicopper oxidase with cupredoxin domain